MDSCEWWAARPMRRAKTGRSGARCGSGAKAVRKSENESGCRPGRTDGRIHLEYRTAQCALQPRPRGGSARVRTKRAEADHAQYAAAGTARRGLPACGGAARERRGMLDPAARRGRRARARRRRTVAARAVQRRDRRRGDRARGRLLRHRDVHAADDRRRRHRDRSVVGCIPVDRAGVRAARMLVGAVRGRHGRRARRVRRLLPRTAPAQSRGNGAAARHQQQRRARRASGPHRAAACTQRGTSPARRQQPQRRDSRRVARRRRDREQSEREPDAAREGRTRRASDVDGDPAQAVGGRHADRARSLAKPARADKRGAGARLHGRLRPRGRRRDLGARQRGADREAGRHAGRVGARVVPRHRPRARSAAATALPRDARRADGPLQPPLAVRPHAPSCSAAAIPRAARRASRSCFSIWSASRRSTTRPATTPAMRCCAASRRGSRPACAAGMR